MFINSFVHLVFIAYYAIVMIIMLNASTSMKVSLSFAKVSFSPQINGACMPYFLVDFCPFSLDLASC